MGRVKGPFWFFLFVDRVMLMTLKDTEFIKVDQATVFNLILGANYLNIKRRNARHYFSPFKHKYGKSCMSKEEHDYRFDMFKTDIVEHPLYEQLVSAHMSCLRIATSVDQLPRIDEQLVQSQSVVDKYSGVDKDVGVMDEKDLDLLHSIKEQLHQHVRVQVMEAVMAC
ncbi:hypothetical protein COP1_018939 [Malus domestica]